MDTPFPDLQTATVTQLQEGLTTGHFTSLDLVKAYIARIHEVNHVLNAVITISPAAFEAARVSDEERKQGKVRSPLHGIPIAIKDNIDTRIEDGMDTTAGSFALQGARVKGDADCVAKLREAGAIILCKANLSEWANYRGVAAGAWSPVGGQCTVPHGHPRGSSSGSGVVIAAGLAAAALGTDTGGSIIAPSSRCGIVGIRPTRGLVSADGIIPISSHRDAAGPMTQTVEDACLVLEAMTGRKNAYTAKIGNKRLEGIRLLAPTNLVNAAEALDYGQKEKLHEAYSVLRDLGAEIIEAPVGEEFNMLNVHHDHVAQTQFVNDIRDYLATLEHVPSGIRNLEDIIQYIHDDPRECFPPFDTYRTFDSALKQPNINSDEYKEAALVEDRCRAAIKAELDKHRAQAIILLFGSHRIWGVGGWPMVTVPLGYLPEDNEIIAATVTDRYGKTSDCPGGLLQVFPNRPYGIVFGSCGFAEEVLVQIAYAFEQATRVRLRAPSYPEAIAKSQISDVRQQTK